MRPLSQMAGGFEEIFPVLMIFAVIIAQIIKAGKSISKKGGKPLSSTGPKTDPADELREFLETLTGAPHPPRRESAVAPPPPPSPVITPAPVVKRKPVVRPVVKTVQPRVRTVPKSVRKAVAEPVAAGKRREFSWDDQTNRNPSPVAPALDTILASVSDRKSLAQAMVLKEILDAPLSLRSRW